MSNGDDLFDFIQDAELKKRSATLQAAEEAGFSVNEISLFPKMIWNERGVIEFCMRVQPWITQMDKITSEWRYIILKKQE